VRVIDLDEANKGIFSMCLEDWSADARVGAPRRARWVERSLPKGLRAKLAVDDDGRVGGMIQYLPIEHSCVDGEGLHVILCTWIHGHPQGRGNFQGRGMGSALLEAAEADAVRRGAKGMVAWGIWLPFWMRAKWYRNRGYLKADRQGLAVLVWKPFKADARPPRWYPRRKEAPATVPGKVTVTSLTSGWCLAGNLTCEGARSAAAEFGDRVVFREIDTSERPAVAYWGRSDALFVDASEVRIGPPPTFEKIRDVIASRVRRL